MDSYLSNEIKINPNGLLFPPARIVLWDTFYKEGFKIIEKEEYFGLFESEVDSLYFEPCAIIFHWLEIYNPANKEKTLTKIHFPKGKDQRDEFKNLVAYYIFQKLKLEEKKDKEKIIRNIFCK